MIVKCLGCKEEFIRHNPEDEDETLCGGCDGWHCSICGYELDYWGDECYGPCPYCHHEMYDEGP